MSNKKKPDAMGDFGHDELSEEESRLFIAMKNARKKAGLTQADLAKRVGISRSLVARYEALWVKPTASVVNIFNVLGWKVSSIPEIIQMLNQGKKSGQSIDTKIPISNTYIKSFDELMNLKFENKGLYDINIYREYNITMQIAEKENKYAVFYEGSRWVSDNFREFIEAKGRGDISVSPKILLIIEYLNDYDIDKFKSGTFVVLVDMTTKEFLIKEITRINLFKSKEYVIVAPGGYGSRSFVITKESGLKLVGVIVAAVDYMPSIPYSNLNYEYNNDLDNIDYMED